MKKLVILVLFVAFVSIFAACRNASAANNEAAVVEKNESEQLLKPRKADSPAKEEKKSKKVGENPVKTGGKAGGQAVLKAAVDAKLDQLAEKVKIFSEKPKESIEKAADAWLDKRSFEICEPVLDGLADKIEKEPENNQIQAEIRRAFDKLFKELDKDAEIRGKLNIENFLYEWAEAKADEKLTGEEKKPKAGGGKKTGKADDKPQQDVPLTENKKNLIGLSLNIVAVQKAIDLWSEKRMTAIWNKALDKMVNNTVNESNIGTISGKVEKQFDELIADLNKVAFVKAKFDRITDEAFFNFMLMMSEEQRFEKIRKRKENNAAGEKIKEPK